MPRATKNRKICVIPKNTVFQPQEEATLTNILTLDELEAIRLADLEEMDQDQAALRMEVSRATFQRILHAARKTIADALVHGKTIQIKGGTYIVADNHCEQKGSCQGCRFEEEESGKNDAQ